MHQEERFATDFLLNKPWPFDFFYSSFASFYFFDCPKVTQQWFTFTFTFLYEQFNVSMKLGQRNTKNRNLGYSYFKHKYGRQLF